MPKNKNAVTTRASRIFALYAFFFVVVVEMIWAEHQSKKTASSSFTLHPFAK
jgi:hypothetical protein